MYHNGILCTNEAVPYKFNSLIYSNSRSSLVCFLPAFLVDHVLFVLFLHDKINSAKLTECICWAITLWKWYWFSSPDTNQQLSISLLQMLLSLRLLHWDYQQYLCAIANDLPFLQCEFITIQVQSRLITLILHLAPTSVPDHSPFCFSACMYC